MGKELLLRRRRKCAHKYPLERTPYKPDKITKTKIKAPAPEWAENLYRVPLVEGLVEGLHVLEGLGKPETPFEFSSTAIQMVTREGMKSVPKDILKKITYETIVKCRERAIQVKTRPHPKSCLINIDLYLKGFEPSYSAGRTVLDYLGDQRYFNGFGVPHCERDRYLQFAASREISFLSI